MTNRKSNASKRALQRPDIERIIANYPLISDEHLHRLFNYFRHEATSADLTRIATNPIIRPQYRQLCSDHRIDRLRLVQRTVAIVAAALAALALASLFAAA